jgi:regulator of sigma D
MPISKENPRAQFEEVETLLTQWLKERQDILTRYTEVVVSTNSALSGPELEEKQRALCALIVDYVGAGHFEIFHELVAEAEVFADGSEKLAHNVIPAIADTTEVILAYDEKYSSADNDPATLERDLSALGEVLESRFVLEDQLIAGLHNTHRKLVTEATSPA